VNVGVIVIAGIQGGKCKYYKADGINRSHRGLGMQEYEAKAHLTDEE